MVARILGKLFYLAGALPDHTVVEMEGRRERVRITSCCLSYVHNVEPAFNVLLLTPSKI